MKSKLISILVLAAAGLTSEAFAGQKYLRYNYEIRLYEGNNSIAAVIYCSEYPDGYGGTTVFGGVQIYGNLDGDDVSEYEPYDGIASCPKDDNVFGGNANQSVTISFNGYVVTANCTDQTTAHGSSTEHIKYPGQRRSSKYLSHFKKHHNDNTNNMSCVATLTRSGNLPEAYDDSVSVRAEHAFSIQQ